MPNFSSFIFAALALVGTCSDAAALAMCKLSPDRCRLVLEEMRQIELQELRDYDLLTGLRPYERRIAVIERKAKRLEARFKALPRDVSDEFARLSLCDSKDRLAGARGTFNDDPQCQ